MGTVAALLAKHVTLRVRAVDRIGVAGYLPKLMHEGGLVQFLLHRASLVGTRNIPSPALLGHNHDWMVSDLDRFVTGQGVAVVRFRRREAKSRSLATPYQLAASMEGRMGVALVGKGQGRGAV